MPKLLFDEKPCRVLSNCRHRVIPQLHANSALKALTFSTLSTLSLPPSTMVTGSGHLAVQFISTLRGIHLLPSPLQSKRAVPPVPTSLPSRVDIMYMGPNIETRIEIENYWDRGLCVVITGILFQANQRRQWPRKGSCVLARRSLFKPDSLVSPSFRFEAPKQRMQGGSSRDLMSNR